MKRAVWITGVPASGKSVLGRRLTTAMQREFSEPCALVDANVIRQQFWPHLGLSPEDRVVNVTGMAELAGVFIRAGSSAVVACIAPDRKTRNRALGLLRVSAQEVAVHQVHVTAPLGVLKARDDKGLYEAHDAGRLVGLTGIDAPYEPPANTEALVVDTSKLAVDDAVEEVLAYLEQAPPLLWGQDCPYDAPGPSEARAGHGVRAWLLEKAADHSEWSAAQPVGTRIGSDGAAMTMEVPE